MKKVTTHFTLWDDNPHLPFYLASNAWVVAPSNTLEGHALLAADPHLPIDRYVRALLKRSKTRFNKTPLCKGCCNATLLLLSHKKVPIPSYHGGVLFLMELACTCARTCVFACVCVCSDLLNYFFYFSLCHSSLPNVWYEVVMHLPNDYRMGVSMVGLPGMLMVWKSVNFY